MRTYLYYSLLAALAACTTDEAAQQPRPAEADSHVETALTFAAGAPATGLTRMAADVVQADGTFRGLTDVLILPFNTRGVVQRTDRARAYVIRGSGQRYTNGYYYYPHCTFTAGVASALFYAAAPAATGRPEHDGALRPHFPTASNAPADSITFSPAPILQTTTEAEARAGAIADYLSLIAATPGWERSADDSFQRLYQNFIGQGNSLLGGSYTSVRAHVDNLRHDLQALNLTYDSPLATLRDNIMDRIASVPDGLDTGYPASLGLPDGAAVLRWMGDGFRPQTQRTTLADINAIDHFAYPAALYYHANSRLLTSRDSVDDQSYATATSWADVSRQYRSGSVVTTETKAVALQDSVQYGISCLRLVMASHEAGTLLDFDNQAVPLVRSDNGTPSFPLTGIIVSGQRTVGYDFAPVSDEDDEDYFVYDRQMGSVAVSQTEQQPVHTLLLQSPAALKIHVLLEFENNSGRDFAGLEGGRIYQGTKFYLAGTVDPTQADNNGHSRFQAFTRAEYTQLNVTVSSLAGAYNVMPNLLSPRLELGIELTPRWIVTTPTDVELF